MNAVVSLCHFCEVHGPSIMMSTQPCRSHNINTSSLSSKFYGPPESLKNKGPSTVTCEACQSLRSNIYVSSDHDSQTSYVSGQIPWQPETEALVRQACTRSLSCEVSPGKEGVLVFSDDTGTGSVNGSSVLSHTFLVRDSLARGSNRWFSVIVLTRDRILLLNMWPFLEANVALFIAELQAAASKVYSKEERISSQRALRLNSGFCADKTSRPLTELTGIPHVFAKLHLWFVWLLRGAATRLRETLPTIDLALPLEPMEETEEGFTIVTAKNEHFPQDSNFLDVVDHPTVLHLDTEGPRVASLSVLRELLGPEDFLRIVYCLLVGRQVVVRGPSAILVASILFTMKILLPRSCVHLVAYGSHYLMPSQCNLLGLESRAAVPQPSPFVARLEVLPPTVIDISENVDVSTSASQFSYHLRWGGQLPPKLPSFLVKLERALESQRLGDRALSCQIAALRQETLNSACILRQLEMQDKREAGDPRDKAALLQALGVTQCDLEILSFWSTGISKYASKRT